MVDKRGTIRYKQIRPLTPGDRDRAAAGRTECLTPPRSRRALLARTRAACLQPPGGRAGLTIQCWKRVMRISPSCCLVCQNQTIADSHADLAAGSAQPGCDMLRQRQAGRDPRLHDAALGDCVSTARPSADHHAAGFALRCDRRRDRAGCSCCRGARAADDRFWGRRCGTARNAGRRRADYSLAASIASVRRPARQRQPLAF